MSHNYRDATDDGDPAIGETAAYGGYSAGRSNPRYTGQTFCGPQQLWQHGSPLALRGTPAVQADGVPVCCRAPGQPVGGLVLDGDSTFTSASTVFFWIRPEEIADVPDFTRLSSWPGAPGSRAGLGLSPGSPRPIKFTDGDTGLAYADFLQAFFPFPTLACALLVGPPLPALRSCSVYLVSSQSSFGSVVGPLLLGPTTHALGVFLARSGLVTLANTTAAAAVAFAGLERQLHVFGCRIGPAAENISVDGVQLQASAGLGSGTWDFSQVTLTTRFVHADGGMGLREIMVFDRYLSDDEHCEVQRYLCLKYGLPVQECHDVLPGTILAWAGPAVPDGYLPCDGSAVSRSDFALLFAALGTTWGIGDGSTTFNVPDLRGRAVIGAGTGLGLSPRALAAEGGEETHTLTTPEIPSHTHGVTDPGHGHQATNALVLGGIPSTGTQIPGDWGGGGLPANLVMPDSFTGISIDAAGGGADHNNMQPFGVVVWIIKA